MASLEEIEKDLDHILTKIARTHNIENFELNRSTEANYGDGFVAQFYTGDIRDKDTGELRTVAIKKAPLYDFDYTNIFKNEDFFYRISIPALYHFQKEAGVSEPFDNVPKYYCGGLTLKKEYIAMENLKPLGYVMFDKTQYLDKKHLEMIFKIYGKFHALSYVLRNHNMEEYQIITNEFTDITPQLMKFLQKPMVESVSAAVKALDRENDKIIFEEIQDFGENILETFLKSCSYDGEHSCLVHGDCWSNNMLFKYSEFGELLDIKLIDFQLSQHNTPIHDLSYFFYSGASKKDFDSLDDYLRIYHQSFSKFATELGATSTEIFSLEVLKNEWKDNALFGVIFGIYLWQVKLIPKKEITDIMNPNQEEPPSMEEGLKLWEALLEKVHRTDAYRERTTAILRHAFEYGVLNKNKIIRNNKD